MNKSDENLEIACTLNEAEVRQRKILARQIILPKIVEYHRAENGVDIQFANTPETFSEVEEFIVLEKGCCGFLSFDLAPKPIPTNEPIKLKITAPSDAMKFIDIFVKLVEDYSNDQDAA